MKENVDQALDTGDMSKSTFTPLMHNFSLYSQLVQIKIKLENGSLEI